MKKVAIVFVVAVILPSLALAWLAVRSLRDEQFLVERQESLLCQRATDSLAQNISEYLAQKQQEFNAQVESIVGNNDAREIGAQFDNEIRRRWSLADVGFCVTLSGRILSPSPNSRPEAQMFYYDNSGFLGNREAVEVYVNNNNNQVATTRGEPVSAWSGSTASSQQALETPAPPASAAATMSYGNTAKKESGATSYGQGQNTYNLKSAQARKVSPQQLAPQMEKKDTADDVVLSKTVAAEAEFAQLIGDSRDGMLARFLQNKLKLMFWHRLDRQPNLVFGAQLNLNQVVNGVRGLVRPDSGLANEICFALLDDNARPVAISIPNFSATWKRPFVATEVGDALPHWEVAAYVVNPVALNRAACYAEIALSLLIAVLVLAIVIGSWLIVRSLNAELIYARQKTDFVSNVSHELKTPLTSIRMFSELLAEGRVADPAKQRSYLQIITAEAGRLTRLINNVLDFSRMERGEKKYNFQACDLADIVRTTAETFRPHLEANGFQFNCDFPALPAPVRGDADALSQIIVNLLSNAEKYSPGSAGFQPAGLIDSGRPDGGAPKKEIIIQLIQQQSPLPHVEVRVLDRGPGVPPGSEEKVFEKFYRAHDSLSSGIQGSGLGLTIARQIARAHGGDVIYEPRDGGGSCFILRLPITLKPQMNTDR